MRTRFTSLSILLALSLAACASDGRQAAAPEPTTPSVPPTPSEEAPVAPDNSAVPLLLWVDDIIEHRSSDEALPDTVDDKNVADTDDATAFDKYLN